MIIFYYKLVDARNGKVMDITSENYLGDVNESGFWNGIPVIISDWCYEELDLA